MADTSFTAPPGETSGAAETEQTPKARRRYSKKFKDLQKLERGVSKAAHRVASSIEEGLRVWRQSSDKSARKKKDGALRDALKNFAKATGKQVRVASWAAVDLVDAIPRGSARRFLARVFFPIYK